MVRTQIFVKQMLIEGSYKLDSFSLKLEGFIFQTEYWVFGKKTCIKIVHTTRNHDYMLANYLDLIVNRGKEENKGRKNKSKK